MTPHVWTKEDVNAAIALGMILGVFGTLGIQVITKAALELITAIERWHRLRTYRKWNEEWRARGERSDRA